MDVYIYCADIYCAECGEAIRKDVAKDGGLPADELDEYTYDSNDYPKGPYADGGGESDCPQHCGNCHTFLENPLTADGYEYVQEALANGTGDSEVLAMWLDYYGHHCMGNHCAECGVQLCIIEESEGDGKHCYNCGIRGIS